MSSLTILPEESPAPAPNRRPPWLRVRAPTGERYRRLRALLEQKRLHTVCSSAACPNVGECWNAGTATFMILGNACTRACRFCDVDTTARPGPVDLDEPARLAEAASLMELGHVVITSVARDDLDDGGAAHFARCLHAVRERLPSATLEVLIPDLAGDEASLAIVVDAAPEVLNHNLETVPRLTPKIRSGARYERSLELLVRAKAMARDRAAAGGPVMKTKSGVMVGLGERDAEIEDTLADLARAQVDIVTIGQYLRPSSWHHPVERFVDPNTFARWAELGRSLGIGHVEAGPLVRSSYHAEKQARGEPLR